MALSKTYASVRTAWSRSATSTPLGRLAGSVGRTDQIGIPCGIWYPGARKLGAE